MAIRTEFVMDLNYVVIMNDGVNEHFAEAGFRSKREAIRYANRRASEYEEFNPSDSDSSAKVAHYEVVFVYGDERDEEWKPVFETKEFYNE